MNEVPARPYKPVAETHEFYFAPSSVRNKSFASAWSCRTGFAVTLFHRLRVTLPYRVA